MVWGVLAGLLSGFFWGLPFLVPQILVSFSAYEVTFGRLFFFAIFSIGILLQHRKVFLSFKGKEWLQTLALSLAGFSLYTLLLFQAIQDAGAILPSVIVGLIPLLVALIGARSKKLTQKGVLGLSAVAIGLLWLNSTQAQKIEVASQPHFYRGLLLSVICLLLWTSYAVFNSDFLQKHRQIPTMAWSSLMGVLSFVVMLPVFYWKQSELFNLKMGMQSASSDFQQFVFWTFCLGVGAGLVANALWNVASRQLPKVLTGQLIVSETIFALLFTFIYQKRLPTPSELIAMGLMIFGILISVRSFYQRKEPT
jgi:drug/metabolite transporter (DMT)-like permease